MPIKRFGAFILLSSCMVFIGLPNCYVPLGPVANWGVLGVGLAAIGVLSSVALVASRPNVKNGWKCIFYGCLISWLLCLAVTVYSYFNAKVAGVQ